MIKLVLITACFVYTIPAVSQINESDTARFQLKSSFTGNYQTGNVEVLTLKSKIDLAVSPFKNVVFKSQNNSLYQAFYSKEADNDLFSRNYLYFSPQHKIYPYLIAYISTNYRRMVTLRYFGGVGATWQLLQLKDHVVKLSANVVYEQTKFNSSVFNYGEYNGSNTITTARATAYMGGWSYLLQRRVRFYYDAYWQPALSNADNYRTQLDIGLDFPLWNGLSCTALYTYSHENVVANKIRQTDNIITFGVAYSLKIKQ